MRRVMSVIAVGLALGLGVNARAQMSGAEAKVAPGTMVEPAKSFDAMLTSFEGEMMGLAKAMPAEKYGFVPASLNVPGAEFTGVRSFGTMVLHVASGNYHYASMVSGTKPSVDLKAMAALTDKDKIVAALADSFAFSHKAMETLTVQNAFESVHGQDTKASLAGELVAHAFDHYGQLVMYLRMNGMVPPASRK